MFSMFQGIKLKRNSSTNTGFPAGNPGKTKLDIALAISGIGIVSIYGLLLFAATSYPSLASAAMDSLIALSVLSVLILISTNKIKIELLAYLAVGGLCIVSAFIHLYYHVGFFEGEHFRKLGLFVLAIISIVVVKLLISGSFSRSARK